MRTTISEKMYRVYGQDEEEIIPKGVRLAVVTYKDKIAVEVSFVPDIDVPNGVISEEIRKGRDKFNEEYHRLNSPCRTREQIIQITNSLEASLTE